MVNPITRIRREMGLSIERFAAALGVPPRLVYRAERGEVADPYRLWLAMEEKGLPWLAAQENYRGWLKQVFDQCRGAGEGGTSDDLKN